MQAAVMTGPGNIEIRNLAVPQVLETGHALLRVTANGLCGSDYDLYTGALEGVRPLTYPLIPGHEMVGVIERVDQQGKAEWEISSGDRVAVDARIPCRACSECRSGLEAFCSRMFRYSLASLDEPPGLWGGLAEYLVIRPGTTVTRLPDSLNDEDGTLLNPICTALHWTHRVGGVTPGARVLILGAGQRGTFSALVARTYGADQVIVSGTDRSSYRLDLARNFGATATVNVDRDNTVERVMELTAGRGVDLVVDTVPRDTSPLLDGIRSLRAGGRVVVGGVKGHPLDGLPVDLIFAKGLQVIGGSGVNARGLLDEALQLLVSHDLPLSKLHTHRFPLAESETAIQVLGGEVADHQQRFHIVVFP